MFKKIVGKRMFLGLLSLGIGISIFHIRKMFEFFIGLGIVLLFTGYLIVKDMKKYLKLRKEYIKNETRQKRMEEIWKK